MAQKEQEAAIDERIERIRKRNEEIQRRYLEVEADKRNAEKLNAAVKFTPPDDDYVERKPFTRPSPVNRNPKVERKIPDKQYVPKPQTPGKKYSEFSDGDGPPPDPVYTFLSDHSRDQPKGDISPNAKFTKDNGPEDEFRGQRGRGRGRGWNRGRGSPGRGGRGGRGGGVNNQSPRQVPQMQPEYQAWRAEREKIDEARITRQKTAEGNWRREWDSEKISQDENEKYQARPVFSKKKKRDGEDMRIQRTVVNDLAISSPPSRENESKPSDKPFRYDKQSPGEKKSSPFIFRGGASSNDTDENPEEVMDYQHRNIVSFGDNIKISLSNKPIKSVRVNPINTAGTGRVGPRQKPRLSYSSQSEDEKEMHAPILRRRAPAFNMKEQQDAKPETAKKPPLPPSRMDRETHSPKKKQNPVKIPTMVFGDPEILTVEKKEMLKGSSHENVSEGGDDSWEDVGTTSGNESAEYSDGEATRSDEGDKVLIGKEVEYGEGEEAAFYADVSDEVKEDCGEVKDPLSDESNGKPEEVSNVTDEKLKNEEVRDVAESEAVNDVGEAKERECTPRESELTAESKKESVCEGIGLSDQVDLPSEESIPTVPTENERPGENKDCNVEKEESSSIGATEEVKVLCEEESHKKSVCDDEVESESSNQRGSGDLQSEPSTKDLQSSQTESGCQDLKDGESDERIEEPVDGSECDKKAGQRVLSQEENLSHVSSMNSDKSP